MNQHVQRQNGLVDDGKLRLPNQGTSDGDALALTARNGPESQLHAPDRACTSELPSAYAFHYAKRFDSRRSNREPSDSGLEQDHNILSVPLPVASSRSIGYPGNPVERETQRFRPTLTDPAEFLVIGGEPAPKRKLAFVNGNGGQGPVAFRQKCSTGWSNPWKREPP